MRSDLKLILQAVDKVQSELYAANKAGDKDAIAEISARLTTLLRCLDIGALINALEGDV